MRCVVFDRALACILLCDEYRFSPHPEHEMIVREFVALSRKIPPTEGGIKQTRFFPAPRFVNWTKETRQRVLRQLWSGCLRRGVRWEFLAGTRKRPGPTRHSSDSVTAKRQKQLGNDRLPRTYSRQSRGIITPDARDCQSAKPRKNSATQEKRRNTAPNVWGAKLPRDSSGLRPRTIKNNHEQSRTVLLV